MGFIEKFLGKRVDIPEDRRYQSGQGLWAKPEAGKIVFGFTEPALVLMGGINDVEWIASDGKTVEKGESIIFAITGKISYIDAPTGGAIHFNPEVKQNHSLISEDPYNRGWLFKIEPETPEASGLDKFVGTTAYVQSLKSTEGCKNPDGLKGGVSGICKAVYSSIREQKL